MKKPLHLIVKLVLTAVLVAACTYFTYILEYLSQLGAVDNLVGAAPLVLICSLAGMLIALIWKRHKNATVSTIALSVLTVIWGLLLIPAVSGSWYPLAATPENGAGSPDMTVYAPFAKDSRVAKLPAASISIHGELPVLDGATALYPVYSAFANAVYNQADFSPGVVVCTNTVNAYKSIISGDCDIIFVAMPAETQKQAAKAAGAELVFTPIGREAFVFLVGKTNPIDGLTYQQLKNIYSGKTANWKTLAWEDGGEIFAFQRPEGSGSQTGLQSIMGALPIWKPRPLPDNGLIGTGSMMNQVSVRWRAFNRRLVILIVITRSRCIPTRTPSC